MLLIQANEDMKRDRDLVTCEAWGQGLSLGGYLQREQRLRAHPWSRAAMQTWFLCQTDGEVLSSCETFRMCSLGAVRDDRREGHTYGVASVYTEPKHRGHRYANLLLDRILERVSLEDPVAQASILFSDVPPEIYERSGYVLRPALSRTFRSEPGEPLPAGCRLLQDTEIERVLERIPLPGDRFLIWPTALQLDWMIERERIYAELLKRPRPMAQGAETGASAALWAADLKNDCLLLLLFHAKDTRDAEVLLSAAKRTAHGAGLGKLLLWEAPVPFEWSQVEDPGRIEDRLDSCESLPMIRPLDPRIAASDWMHVPKALWM